MSHPDGGDEARASSGATRSPMRNRVTPLGDIVAIPLRGSWLGNRGILHEGTDVVRFHRGNLWIICALQYKDWRLPQWADAHLTVLFFHDEAVAFAAGHRPCALCRRGDYNAFRQAWAAGNKTAVPWAKEIDRQLHAERIVRGTHRRRLHPAQWASLPPGAFASLDDRPVLVLEDRLVPWGRRGYGPPRDRPKAGSAEVITPPSTLAAFRAGHRPQIDGVALSG
ncbi:MAG: hypothetical protein ACLQNG_04845 [Acidimicrobiales bacterium]